MKKHLLFITANTHVPWGGSEELWSKTATHLAQAGKYKISALAKNWQPRPKHIHQIIQAGGHFESLSSSFTRRIITSIKARVFNIHKSSKAVPRLLKKINPDFVVLSLGSQLQGAGWMSLLNDHNIPYANIIQLASELQWTDEGTLRKLSNGYQNARHNFFVSKHNLNFTTRQMAIPMKNASVVRNPFKVTGKVISFPSTENGYQLACPASYVAFHKGQDVLLELFAQQKWQERPISLNLYGKGMHEAYFKRFIEFKQLNKVHVRGFVNDIDELWRNNHAIILASRMEGMPLALIEALLSGRTAIVPDVAGNAECIQDNVTGFIAKAPTLELLDEALERAWQNRQDWETIGQNAAKEARKVIPEKPVEVFAEQLTKLID